MNLFLIERLRTHTPTGARAVLNGFVHLEMYIATVYRWGATKARKVGAAELSYELISSFSRWIFDTAPDNSKYLSFIKQLYAYGLHHGFSGFSSRGLILLQSVVAKGSPKGHLARFRDPRKGALTWEEQRQVIAAIEAGTGADPDRAIVQLFHETGIRLEAAIRLRRRHLRPTPSFAEYFLDVPRVKRRRPTAQTKEMVISESLAHLLISLLPDDANDETFLLHWLNQSQMANHVGKQMASWVSRWNITTLRINDGQPSPLPLSPYRFRRTLATNLAENGAPPEVIAEMLDDKSLAMAVVYVSNSSSIVDVLERTLDRHPAWFRLLHLFQGKITSAVDVKLPDILGGVPHLADYIEFASAIGAIGKCANPKPCLLQPPLSCYRCPDFRASDDARSHELQLEQLKREIDASVGVESDRIAGILRDEMVAILAAAARAREVCGAASYRTDRGAVIRRSIATERIK